MAEIALKGNMKVKTLKADFKKDMQVGNFEKKIAEMYGIGVQVANAKDTELADNSGTISAAGRA